MTKLCQSDDESGLMDIKKVSDNVYEIPQGTQECMKVPVKIYASDKLVSKMKQDATFKQATNAACLPGIYKHSIVLPDGHQGYGFPIGGVAATDYENGVISPGEVGYDINCGVRVLRTNLDEKDVRPDFSEEGTEPYDGLRCDVFQCLIGFHEIEVMIRLDLE